MIFLTYQRINFEENRMFPKYSLYGYAEGHLTEFARNMNWQGAPVLFIPGNSGSYKQVMDMNIFFLPIYYTSFFRYDLWHLWQ